MIHDEQHDHPGEEENYFVSMTDMMVGLVFIFIIILMYYALQFRDVTDQLAGADQTREEILSDLKQSLKLKGVTVEIDYQNGILRLPDAILFDPAHDELKPEGRVKIKHLAEALWEVLPCYTDVPTIAFPDRNRCDPNIKHHIESFYIEGHTDQDRMNGNVRIKDNWDLSVNRATNTYREVINSDGRLEALCADKGNRCEPILSVSGYGDKRPVAAGSDDETKKRNRRIDLRIIMIKPDSGEAARAVAKAVAIQ